MNLNPLAAEEQFLNPLDRVNGFDIRPGLYEINGATSFGSCVNFTIHSQNAVSCELLLFHRGEKEPYGTIPFPENYRIGRVYSMIVFGLDIYDFEYAYRMDGPNVPEKGLIYDKTKVLLDPYARAVTQQSIWGKEPDREKGYHGRVVFNDFDWGDAREPKKPMQELIIYEMHVRGFTKHASSGVQFPGTFEGIREKIPYLKALGITAVELMPVFEFDETMGKREIGGRTLLDYWGYNTVGFFAPNTGYTARQEYNREGTEFKNLIRELHQNGIEVILDVVFNHTAEGNEQGPFFEFKGIDNRIYYMLTPEGNYYNFSGCGNTLNCNHPVVQQMILECLRHWVIHYRVDGFRFDLASILGRNEDGTPLLQPPLLRNLAEDPVLKDVNLIAEAWDAGGLYQVGNFPAWNRWAEWNGKYRDELRSFLKGEYWFAAQAAKRITGSPDLYGGQYRGYNSSINFLTCHDGFTLYDLYSYNEKHNEENGWNNTDGADDNRSWNCGYEGKSDNPGIEALRKRMIKNACAVLLCSRGTPMFLAGDEFCNTQFGNNNAYCQDNEISWLDWSLLEKNREIYEFFRYMIAFRKKHSAIRGECSPSGLGFPTVSVHTNQPWDNNVTQESKFLGVMFAGAVPAGSSQKTGRNQENAWSQEAERRRESVWSLETERIRELETEDLVYLAVNVFWEDQQFFLPKLPNGFVWRLAVNTDQPEMPEKESQMTVIDSEFILKPRSVAVFVGGPSF